MVQNDLQAIKDKIRQLESGSGSGSTVGSDVSTAVGRGPSGTFARPPQGVVVRSYFCHDEWSSKVESRTTSSAGTKGSQTQRFRISPMICTRWYLMRSKKKTLIGSKPGTNKEHGQSKLW